MVKIFPFIFWLVILFLNPGAWGVEDLPVGKSHLLRILIDPRPATLNPRATLDASGQMLNALMFRALTTFDRNGIAKPDLAEDWKTTAGGKTWIFKIKTNLSDGARNAISASDVAQCLENYRTGNPPSVFREAFPNWKSTQATEDSVVLKLDQPDPYLPNNLSLLRFFRTPTGHSPCEEPKDHETVITSGEYHTKQWEFYPENEITLVPDDDRPELKFIFVQDDNTKAIKLLNGEIDIVSNAILSRRSWLESHYSDRFQFMDREGVRVSYLAFNLKDPILSNPDVRRAISLSIDRSKIVRTRYPNFCAVAGSILSPLLPESHPVTFPFDPIAAETLLERAGFPRKKDGVRFTLHYKTTPLRETTELALILQKMLKKVGIGLSIDVVESAVFFSSIRKGAFQLYSSRWLGIKDGSILYRILHSGQSFNRVQYSNEEMDRLLDKAVREPDLAVRKELLKKVQIKMAEDLPYLPLWYWNNTLILRKGLSGITPDQISLSGTLEPLTHVR